MAQREKVLDALARAIAFVRSGGSYPEAFGMLIEYIQHEHRIGDDELEAAIVSIAANDDRR